MFELKVVDHKFKENYACVRNEKKFPLLFELAELYGPDLVDDAYQILLKGEKFEFELMRNHNISISLLPVAN